MIRVYKNNEKILITSLNKSIFENDLIKQWARRHNAEKTDFMGCPYKLAIKWSKEFGSGKLPKLYFHLWKTQNGEEDEEAKALFWATCNTDNNRREKARKLLRERGYNLDSVDRDFGR